MSLSKESGRFTEEKRIPQGGEHPSNPARKRPLILDIEEAEAPHATGSFDP
jgi:hypothetical protein